MEYSQGLKLLYVEDNKASRESTQMILEEFFVDIIVAEDGEEGYEKFKTHNIDLIVTDINMPRLNGLEMIRKIRRIDQSVSILILSAHNESGYVMDSIKLDVDGYLLKPIEIEQFLGGLAKVTDKLKFKKEARNNFHFLNQYQKATYNSAIVSKTDLNGIITYVNNAFCKISEYREDELIGKSHNIVRHPDNQSVTYKEMWKTIKEKKQMWKGLIRNISKSGRSYYVKSTVVPILDINGNIVEYIAIRDDITDIMNPKKQLDDTVKSSKEPVVVYMKLEEFDTLEEFYDHTTVEEIQDKIAKYLEENIPENFKFKRVYQLGNGEYAMTNERSVCMQDEDACIALVKNYQETIRDAAVDIGDIDYDMSLIISLAYEKKQVLESAKLGIQELLRAKQALIISNNFAYIEHHKAQRNMQTVAMIKKAINNAKIVSYFQPIVNNKTKQIEKYESLVRLIDEDGKVLPPCLFLEVAKKGKYYSQITSIVLDNSFSALANTDMNISINLSALDIELKSTRDKIFKLLKEYKQYRSRLLFELLEDESVKDFRLIKNFIQDVKDLGVKIAIDDFGSGYSNFERLLEYQPDILKIDACLIKDIQTNSYSLSVVETIVDFAKKQNILTVAEFVENEAVFDIVNDLGIDYSQGYYFGKAEALK